MENILSVNQDLNLKGQTNTFQQQIYIFLAL